MKTCKKCNETKPLTEFFKDKSFSDGHYSRCKKCKTESTMKWREENLETYNAGMRKYNKKHYKRFRMLRYKITPEQYEELKEKQNNLCAICKKPPQKTRPLAIDHNHLTGKVRGLLCYSCNRNMHLIDNKKLLNDSIVYSNQ